MACSDRRRPRAPMRCGAVVLALLALAGPPARAQPVAAAPSPAGCAPRALRWQEDCGVLAGLELHGLDRLRYRMLSEDPKVWLTLGGEARARIQAIEDDNFGIAGTPGYTSVSGRLLLHADVRSQAGPRAFVQLGVVGEDGRKPGPRPHERSALDVTQAFVDVPASLGRTRMVARLGRQELELSGNRLVAPRDGASLPRTFDGVRLDALASGARVSLVSVRPVDLRPEAFADRTDRTERFSALSVDLPTGVADGALNLFLFDRQREDASYLRARGAERRYSAGAHYVGAWRVWKLDAQGTWQFGRVAGLPVRAYGAAVSLDRALGGPLDAELGLDLIVASGDRAASRAIETFDPTYPNNGGLAAPLIYQSNYVYMGGGLSGRWAGAIWTGAVNLVGRQSTEDGVYANGRPLAGAVGDRRLTSLLTQLNVRRRVGRNLEAYARVARADALAGIVEAGGHDVTYYRLDLTARF